MKDKFVLPILSGPNPNHSYQHSLPFADILRKWLLRNSLEIDKLQQLLQKQYVSVLSCPETRVSFSAYHSFSSRGAIANGYFKMLTLEQNNSWTHQMTKLHSYQKGISPSILKGEHSWCPVGLLPNLPIKPWMLRVDYTSNKSCLKSLNAGGLYRI